MRSRVRSDAINTYGDNLTGLLDEVTAAITTDTDALQQKNAEASEGRSVAERANDRLEDNLRHEPSAAHGTRVPIVPPRWRTAHRRG